VRFGVRMSAGVRCGAARPVQLRGAARSVLLLQRVAPASRGSQRFGRCARLDQGCAARLVVAAEGEPEPAARRRGRPRKAADGEPAQAEPQKRKPRPPRVGELGEKTADGKPKPDERTVEDLVRRGWLESEEDAVALLTRLPSRENRFPYETAQPAADWLEATLGLVLLKGGLLPAAKAVNRFPELLLCDAATLQHKWDAMTLMERQGGVGIAFSQEQAREAVLKHPQILSYATDKLKRGWSMLTAAEGGLGLSPEEARSRILFCPNVLLYDHDAVVRRVELLMSLGYPEAHKMVLKASRVLNYTQETVSEHDAWWKQTRLDHVKLVSKLPTLLGGATVVELQARLDFLRIVVGMSTADLNNAPSLFANSLDDRLRARYFYALLKGRLARFTSMSTMFKTTDAAFLAMLQGESSRGRASELDVARYDKLVKSAKFVSWRERQEAQRMQSGRLAGTDA
jgi:hypothetical protein